MQLTHGERLIIVMLAEVMEALSLNKEIDPALVKTLAIDNDGWALRRQYPGLFESSAPSDDVVKETTDILWMFGIIESSIDRLSGDEAEAAKGWHYGKWRGFDANNDPHYGVARTMIETLGEFADSRKDGNLNSHSQMSLPAYRAMYAKFERYVNAGKAAPLSFEALSDICS